MADTYESTFSTDLPIGDGENYTISLKMEVYDKFAYSVVYRFEAEVRFVKTK